MLIDSLAYVDRGYTQEREKSAERMIKEEAGSLANEESYKYEEYEPVTGIDVERYKMLGSKEESEEGWKKAEENGRAQVENQNTRIVNLELMSRYLKPSLEREIMNLEWIKARIENEAEMIEEEISEINRARKEAHVGYKRAEEAARGI